MVSYYTATPRHPDTVLRLPALYGTTVGARSAGQSSDCPVTGMARPRDWWRVLFGREVILTGLTVHGEGTRLHSALLPDPIESEG